MTPYVRRLAVQSMRLPHAAAPAGVPDSFDWASGPVVHAGLKVPPGMAAVTGWGHCFVAATAERQAAILDVRDMQMWARYGGSWGLVQMGIVEGALYRADYAANEARGEFLRGPLFDSIGIRAGEAAHWWPDSGRADLPTGITALTVSFRARASADRTLLAGAGADYWISRVANWDQNLTNPPVGMGRLRWVGTRWSTFAMGL